MKGTYRAGQKVLVEARDIGGIGEEADGLVECMVVCASCSGDAYRVAVPGREDTAVVGVGRIATPPETITPRPPGDIGVAFFGNGDFALPVLEHLAGEGYDIRAVVTNPDSRQGRGRKSMPTAVARYARAKGMNVLAPVSASDPGLVAALKSLRPDIGVVVEYGVLPKAVHRMPRFGTVNLHSSLLPQYRGASTVSSAIRDGREYTGLTTFLLSDVLDGGDIVNNLVIPIGEGDSAGDVLARMRLFGPGLVSEAIGVVTEGGRLVPQDVIGRYVPPTAYAAKVFHSDLMVDWGMPAARVCDFVRAYSPSPSAWTDMGVLGGSTFRGVKVHRAAATDIATCCAPGTWRTVEGMLLVSAADLLVSVGELQLPGGRRITARDFCNGFRGPACGRCALPAD